MYKCDRCEFGGRPTYEWPCTVCYFGNMFLPKEETNDEVPNEGGTVMESGFFFDPKTGRIKEKNPKVTVSKAGVMEIAGVYNKEIYVNSENMIKMLEGAIDQMKQPPVKTAEGYFAARVTISVEFLGEMEENMLEDAENEENSHPV